MAHLVCPVVSAEDRQRLAAVLADRNRPQKHVARARIILASAERLDVAEVARRAQISRPAVWRWQQRFAEAGVDGLLRDRTRKPGKPATPDASFISFTNVVEAHVLAGLRRRYDLKLESIRAAVRYVHERLGVNHPLAHEQFKTDGVSLFVDRFGHLINATKEGQIGMRQVLDAYLERIDYANDGRAIRFFPLLREAAPRVIVVDPRRSFGRPIIAGTSVPVVAIRGRFDAGDDVEQLARDYDVRSDQIQEALRATSKAA